MSRWSDRWMDLAERWAPPERAEWLMAMRSELAFIPEPRRVSFAFGCLGAVLAWRIWTPSGVRTVARAALAFACGAFALYGSAVAALGLLGRLSPAVAVLALYFGCGCIVILRGGFKSVAAWACVGLLVYSTPLLAIATWPYAEGIAPYLRAVVLEGYILMAAFVGAAALAQGLARRLERAS